MSHLVITLVVLSIANLKCGSMLGGQVNPMISIIIDNNSNDNYSTELFSAPISQVGAEESVHINCGLLASRSLLGASPTRSKIR